VCVCAGGPSPGIDRGFKMKGGGFKVRDARTPHYGPRHRSRLIPGIVAVRVPCQVLLPAKNSLLPRIRVRDSQRHDQDGDHQVGDRERHQEVVGHVLEAALPADRQGRRGCCRRRCRQPGSKPTRPTSCWWSRRVP
jgi:hypothetical protein